MAFSTVRGRPRKMADTLDLGTPELRLKHAFRLTTEPIDLCLEKSFITQEQHWCGLHLRWLYTLRYGAPSVTTSYADRESPPPAEKKEDPDWRMMREREYHEAVQLLKREQRYECVMRLVVYNERPSFLSPALRAKALQHYPMARELAQAHHQLREGLDLLTGQWRRRRAK